MYVKNNLNNLINNHLRLKLLHVNCKINKINTVTLSINLYKLKSIQDPQILENLFLLEFLTLIKSVVKHEKKNYQSVNLQLEVVLRRKHIDYYFRIMKVFYASILNRRGGKLFISYDMFFNTFFKIEHMTYLPLMPSAYFKHKQAILVSNFCKSLSEQESYLLLNYFTSLK